VSRCGRGGGVVLSACRFVSDFFCWVGTRFGLRFVSEIFFAGGDGLTRQNEGKKITPTFVGAIFLLLYALRLTLSKFTWISLSMSISLSDREVMSVEIVQAKKAFNTSLFPAFLGVVEPFLAF
jgi:hypothetical protein